MGWKDQAQGQIVTNDDLANDHTAIANVATRSIIGVHVIIDNDDAVGSFFIQASNYPDMATSWVNIVFSDDEDEVEVESGTDVNMYFEIETAAPAIRFFYDFTSGSGANVCNVFVTSKTRR